MYVSSVCEARFGTLDKIAEQIHSTVQEQLFKKVAKRLTSEQRDFLENLLMTEFAQRQTQFNQIKRSAKRASKKHLENLLDQLTASGHAWQISSV